MVVACARRGERPTSAAPSSRCRRSIMARSIAAAPDRVRAKLRERVLFHWRMILSENWFPSRSSRGHAFRDHALRSFREADGGLEGIAAGVALPQMAHAALIDQFRPFRHEQVFATLR